VLPVAGDEQTGDYVPSEVVPRNREPRLGDDVLARLARVPGLTATASDVLDGLGCPLVVPGDVLVPRLESAAVAGHATTLRYLPERRCVHLPETRRTPPRLAHETAFEMCERGDVLVVDACGIAGTSTFGGMAAVTAVQHGVAGIVVDGAIRDLDEIREVGLPAWSRSITPRTGKWRLEAVAVNAPVCCGGQQVVPGDVVLADASGVCFIPTELTERAVAEIFAVAEREGARLREDMTAA
jgi:4-hydroxy-4-methyl-2-oxoglutarate aldolase